MEVGSSSRGRRSSLSQINVTPFVDVMLVLLIIFMITAPLLSQGVEIDLPTADANPISPDQQEPLVVAVNKQGDYFLNIGDEQDKAIQAQLMVNRVAAVLNLRPDTPVLVRGDRDVSYGKVVRAMVLLQQAGVEKVGLMTEGLN